MTNGEVLDLMYEVFVLAVQLGGPVLVISMLSLLISIIQALSPRSMNRRSRLFPSCCDQDHFGVYGREHAAAP